MLQMVFIGQGSRALKAHVRRRERCDGSAVLVRRSLSNNGHRVEEATEYHLVMADGAIHDLLRLRQQSLDMLLWVVSLESSNLFFDCDFEKGVKYTTAKKGRAGCWALHLDILG